MKDTKQSLLKKRWYQLSDSFHTNNRLLRALGIRE